MDKLLTFRGKVMKLSWGFRAKGFSASKALKLAWEASRHAKELDTPQSWKAAYCSVMTAALKQRKNEKWKLHSSKFAA